MSLKAGIVGLPNVGKSTLFNAITNLQVEAANYPFATIEPNIGLVELKDARLNNLARIVNPERILPATFEFIDIAGLVQGASKGEGLGNKFLSNIREVDAIVHVVRCFVDENITHVNNKIDPINDIEIINTELLLADMETIQKILARVERKALQTKDKVLMAELGVAKKVKALLDQEKPARNAELNEEDAKIAKGWHLLTLKPVIYVGNVAEKHVSDPSASPFYQKVKEYALKQNAQSLGISAKIEGEISVLEEEDKKMFLDDLKIDASGLERLTHASFDLLGLASYFTSGVKEVRAWVFKKGMKAPECAGVIHTDFERGFIKAEVVSYEDFVSNNGEQGAKAAGKYRLEGKAYEFKDGDIANFKFNV